MAEVTPSSPGVSAYNDCDNLPELPRELWDIVLDWIPVQYLRPCTLVCKSWCRTTSPRVLSDFTWPLNSLAGQENLPREDNLFVRFLDLLSASPRLRNAISILRLGCPPSRTITDFYLEDFFCSLKISTLVSIISLCPRLDSLTFYKCHVMPTEDGRAFLDGHCGRMGTLAFVSVSVATDSHPDGISPTLSLFTQVDTLKLGAVGIAEDQLLKPLPQSLGIGSIECYRPRDAFELGSMRLYSHLCATPSVRSSLRTLAPSEPISQSLVDAMQHLVGLEEVRYRVQGHIRSPFAAWSNSLRRLTLYADDLAEPDASAWHNMAQDLGFVPRTVQHVTLCIPYHHRPMDVMDMILQAMMNNANPDPIDLNSLAKLKDQLLRESWRPLEDLIRRCPSFERLELRVCCSHLVQQNQWEDWEDEDFDGIKEVYDEVIRSRLSQSAAKYVEIVPTKRYW